MESEEKSETRLLTGAPSEGNQGAGTENRDGTTEVSSSDKDMAGEAMCMDVCYTRITKWFQGKFRCLGEFIGSHPVKLIIACLVVCIGLGIGMLRLTPETDIEVLYTPVGSRATQDREMYLAMFPDKSRTNFMQQSLRRLNLYGDVVFSGENVLTSESLGEIDTIIDSVTSINTTYNGKLYSFSDLCAMLGGKCAISGSFVTRPDFVNEITNGSVSYPNWERIDISKTFGDAEISGRRLTSARFLRVTFSLRQDTEEFIAASKAWEDSFKSRMSELKASNVEPAYSTSQSLNQELNSNTKGDIGMFSITFTLMITYATVVAGGDIVSSRTWASWAGVIAAAMGVVSSFGLISLCGVKFVNIVGVTPFLIIGIGLDDMFLLMSCWAETHELPDKEVRKRLGHTFASAGVGITITSLTDLIAFVMGTTSVFVSVRNFCLYTGVAIFFCYLYQCFFFGSCLALHGRRVDDNRHCITCRRVESRAGVTASDGEAGGTQRSSCYISCCTGDPPKERGSDERVCETYPRIWLPRLLLNVYGKIVVMVCFLIYLGFSIWGAVNLRQGLDLKNLVSQNSHFYTYNDIVTRYYENTFPLPFVFKAEADYTDGEFVDKVKALLTKAALVDGVQNDSKVCWISVYRGFPMFNNDQFVEGLSNFLSFVPAFSNDVELSDDGSQIKASRCYLFTTNITDSAKQAQIMTEVRSLADQSGLPVFVYHPAFIYYEQYVSILPSTLQTVGIALVGMVVITFIFLPNPLLVALVTLNILSILVGIFGFLYFWGLTLSSVTMVHLIMSVGFSVDFSVHVCSAFMLSQEKTRNGKAESSIVHAAGPILNGGFSSFVGIIVLVFSKSYIFLSFFKVMFTVIVFGILHAVLLLPVVLSVVGPLGCTKVASEERRTNDTEPVRVSLMDNGKEGRYDSAEPVRMSLMDNGKEGRTNNAEPVRVSLMDNEKEGRTDNAEPVRVSLIDNEKEGRTDIAEPVRVSLMDNGEEEKDEVV